MKNKILIAAGIIVIAIIGIFLFGVRKTDNNGGSAPNTPSETPGIVDTSNWKTYRNEELGFELKYPEEWGELNFTVSSGESGKVFSGAFPNGFARFSFYTVDWSRPIGIGPIFRSYTRNSDGSYNYHRKDDLVVFNATKVVVLSDGGEALIIKGKDALDLYSNLTGQSIDEAGSSEFIHFIEKSVIYAFANFTKNLDGSLIKGLEFVSFGGPSYDAMSDLEAQTFEFFVSSFKRI